MPVVKIKLIALFVCLFASLFFFSCALRHPRVDRTGRPQYEYVYKIPERTGDGWETASLKSQGLDSERIEKLVKSVLNRGFKNIYSILIVKNKKLVLEEYFYGNNRDKQHMLRSATKSVTSILVGIAKDMGLINRLDQKIQDIFPEYSILDWQGPKKDITLEHVLTMTAGLKWNEWLYSDRDSRSTVYEMAQSNDWIKSVLEQNMTGRAGEGFNYSSGLSLVLGAILKNKTGISADVFAQKHLFGPMGITQFSWQKGPNSMVFTSGGEKGLWLRPRDMAKIGLLMLNKGEWNGRQIVSAEWVEKSTLPHVKAFFAGSEYGYQWWRGEKVVKDGTIDLFYAAGHGGQYIFCCPSLDLVAVFTSKVDSNPLGVVRPQIIMTEHIIPALVPVSIPEKSMVPEHQITDEYTGRYECSVPKLKLKVFKEGDQLYCSIYFKKARLNCLSESKFYADVKDIGRVGFRFLSDTKGRVNKIIAKIGFGILEFKKKI